MTFMLGFKRQSDSLFFILECGLLAHTMNTLQYKVCIVYIMQCFQMECILLPPAN